MTKKQHTEESSEETIAQEAHNTEEAQTEEVKAEETKTEKPAKKEPKERTFVDAKTGKTIAHPHQGGSTAEATESVRTEMHEQRKGNALPFRIGAIVLWVLGIVCEIMAILVVNGTLFMPGFPPMTWLLIWLVVDLVLVVIGSQLWKKANHIAPASKENKLAYWVQTDLGVIIAAIAFAPIIVLLLTSKDTDKRTKQVGSIVAAVALAVAVGSGIDYHPTTQEDRDQAEAGAAVLSDGGLCYWTPFGEVYHFNPDCQYIKNSGTIYSGSVQEALDAKRTRGCSGCTVEGGSDIITNSDPADIAAAVANVISIGSTDTNQSEDKPSEKEALPKAA